MNNKQKIDKLFNKYKLKEPVPQEIRIRINKSKKKILINILGHGKKNIPLIIIVSILLFFKKFGINLTLLKSAVLAGIFTIILTGTAIVSSAAVYFKITNPNNLIKPDINISSDKNIIPKNSFEKNENISADKSIEAPKIRIPFEIGIMNFYSDADSSDLSAKIASGVIQSLIKSKKPDFAGFISESKTSNKAKKILTGSVLKQDNIYKITLKLVDFETTQISAFITESIEKEDDVAKAAESIAKKILEKL